MNDVHVYFELISFLLQMWPLSMIMTLFMNNSVIGSFLQFVELKKVPGFLYSRLYFSIIFPRYNFLEGSKKLFNIIR